MKRNTDRRRTFTTTLPGVLLRELDRAAKELGMRKNEIIAEAFVAWNEERKRVLLTEAPNERVEHQRN